MSSDDFAAQLAEQLDLLTHACEIFDKGKPAQAFQMAAPLSAIFHKHVAGNSLLSQLNATTIKMLSTAIEPPPSASHWISLVSWDLDPGISAFRATPLLGSTKRSHRTVTRSTWWESEVICKNGHQRIRRDLLIKSLANLGNGVPLASNLPEPSRWLLDGTAWKTTQQAQGAPSRVIHLIDALPATLRQMAFEVIHSPELMKLAARA